MDSFVACLSEHIAHTPDPLIESYLDAFKVEAAETTFDDSTLIPIDVNNNNKFHRDLDNFFESIPKQYRNNLVLAGGSVLRNILAGGSTDRPEWKRSDYDFFIVGSDEPEKVIDAVLSAYVTNFSHSIEKIIVTPHAISIYHQSRVDSQYQKTINRASYMIKGSEIQIILRQYQSVAHVLRGFDLDVCRFAWVTSSDVCNRWLDGKFLTTLTGQWTLKNMCLIPTPFFSTTYETRIAKYQKRGFRLYIPFITAIKPFNEDQKYGLSYLLHCTNQKAIIDNPSDYWTDYTQTTVVGDMITAQRYSLPENCDMPMFITQFDKQTGQFMWISIKPWSISEETIAGSLTWPLIEAYLNRIYSSKHKLCLSDLIERDHPQRQGSGSFHPRPEITTYQQWLEL